MVFIYGERYKKEDNIVGKCIICGKPVTKSIMRNVLGEIYCKECFRKRYIQPIVDRRIYKYTNFFRSNVKRKKA